jgi:hypothetical protein
MEKPVPGGGISVPVTGYVAVDVPFGSLAPGASGYSTTWAT